MPLFVFGVITPSKGVLTYCDYNLSEKKLTLNTCEEYEVVSAIDDTTVFYWKSSEKYIKNDTNYFPTDVVLSDPMGRVNKHCLLFPARVEASVINESKVVGYYDISKFPADLDGPLVGVGQACYDEGVCGHVRKTPIKRFMIHVPYDGKTFEQFSISMFQQTSWSVSCHLSNYKLSHCFWSSSSTDAIAAGVAPNGEVLYVGWGENEYEIIPGYIVPSEHCLYICYDGNEEYFGSDNNYSEYEALTIEDQDGF